MEHNMNTKKCQIELKRLAKAQIGAIAGLGAVCIKLDP